MTTYTLSWIGLDGSDHVEEITTTHYQILLRIVSLEEHGAHSFLLCDANGSVDI